MATQQRLLIFAGPNGSGKSTITTPATLRHYGITQDRYINADEIARHLHISPPELLPTEYEPMAFRRARELREIYREQGVYFAFETVFSHPSTLLDMQKSRSAGFEVVVLFVTTEDVMINIARIAGRVRSGGHDVPEDRIRNPYERSMSLLPRIVEEAGRAFIYDNSGAVIRIFAFQNGLPITIRRLPAYLQQRLVIRLSQRQSERAAIEKKFGEVVLPEIERGEYVGELRWISDNYLVQAIGTNLVRHDHLLLTGIGEIATIIKITYKAGQAKVASSPTIPTDSAYPEISSR